MAEEAQVKQLRELLQACTATPIGELVHKPDWGRINFEVSRVDLERLFAVLDPLQVLPIEILPNDVVQNAIQHVTAVKNRIDQIKNYTIEQSNPVAIRDGHSQQLKAEADQVFRTIGQWIPYLAYQRGDVDKSITRLADSVSEAKFMLEEARSGINKKNQEIDQIIAATREASATVGVAHFTRDFDTEADKLEGSAFNWLVATTLLAIATIVAALVLLFALRIPAAASLAQIVQFTTTKIVILASLFTATLWCSKMFRSSKHQAAINKHRSNALKTFQAFVQAASDETTRNAVLMETTRSIFAITPSGYLGTTDGGSDSEIRVVELIKGTSEAVAKG